MEVKVDNEHNYFRVKDTNKNQYLDPDGNVPKTGHMKGKQAKDLLQRKTHIKNTDRS